MRKIINQLFSSQNQFFLLTKDAKRLTHISLSSLVMPIIFIVISGLLTSYVFAPLFITNPKETSAWIKEVFGLYFLFGIIIILIFLWIKFFEGRSIRSLGFVRTGAVKNYLSGFGLGLFMNTVVVGIMAIFGSIEVATESENLTGIDALGIVLIFLFGFIIQGASEEILTRGWITQVIGARYKPWLGVLIATILFSVMHLGNAGINFLSTINLLFFAIMMALMVMKDESLWSACGWHSAWNWSLGNFYGLSVSGTGEKTTIFDLNTIGNELVSGGGFGPEGSLITTLVLITAIVGFSFIIIKKANYGN